ncbi:MAG: SEC-C domain-containing protein [Coriobacteriia bacterium]|nr:SEC-C domain-containing protein [Coriobacteriia bacterium]
MTDRAQFYALSGAMLDRAAACANQVGRDTSVHLQRAEELSRRLDREFHFRETGDDVFAAKFEAVKALPKDRQVEAMNSIVWRDTNSLMKAWLLSSTWRILELIDQTVLLLNANGVLGPAVLARSLIELTAVNVYTGSKIRTLVSASELGWSSGLLVATDDLDQVLRRAMFGTRKVPEGDPVRQTNVMTRIDKLSKHPGWGQITDWYGDLCEVAHPNVEGNVRFWIDGFIPQPDGSILRRGTPSADNAAVDRVIESTFCVLGWSACNAVAGFGIVNEQIDRIAKRFPADSVMSGPFLAPVGRNDACPCGSQKKYKHCCGAPPP